MMRFFSFALLLGVLAAQPAGAIISFKMVSCTVLPHDTATGSGRLGGISAMRYLGDGQLALYSDHDRDGLTYEVITDTVGNIVKTSKWNSLQSVEGVRTYKKGFYFAYEKNSSTGVGYWAGRKTEMLFSETIPGPNTSDNRGVEGIALEDDGSLWAAFEAGGSTNCTVDNLPFYYFPEKDGKLDGAHPRVYQYPFERCSCSSSFNGKIGNGVSEILNMPGEKGKLLVIERCFSGFQAKINLYLAEVQPTGSELRKTLVFSFNDPITINGRRFYPDNLEAMDWGPIENGRRTLYIVSDDNFNVLQRTQIIKLVEDK